MSVTRKTTVMASILQQFHLLVTVYKARLIWVWVFTFCDFFIVLHYCIVLDVTV